MLDLRSVFLLAFVWDKVVLAFHGRDVGCGRYDCGGDGDDNNIHLLLFPSLPLFLEGLVSV